MSLFQERSRLDIERQLDANMSPGATRTTRGRLEFEHPDPHRSAFDRDRDRVLHAKAFRRLKHKTQVFINPEGDHYVTRLTHTLQVTQIGRSIARYLGLNEPLAEAICLAHDVGHSPFGHTGEEALSDYVEGEWLHSEQGVRVFSVLEPLNLTWEVLDGVRAHSWKIAKGPATPEGMVCRFADRIAYLTHDVEDAVRAEVITVADLPARAKRAFGVLGSEWIHTLVQAVVSESAGSEAISMDPETLEVMNELREFMFERVYLRPESLPQRNQAMQVVHDLVDHVSRTPELIPETYQHSDATQMRQVLDYVSGMTDRYALRLHDELT
ncbi:MAG: HD domain-containing protein [Acidimicrobiia bacterium]|nr:HD domain-containing protein [Acidimicrobiia bacterium]